jgi:abortive infection bacteriophage resistance protein
VLDVIERIEIALRTALSNHLALSYNPWWYTNDKLFKSSWCTTSRNGRKNPKEAFFSELNAICKKRKHNETIKRYYDQYSSPKYPPSWIALEFLSFGKCTSLFRYLRSHHDKNAISNVFGVHHKIFESTLEPLRYTRNLCAHHSRLWDRWFVYKPRNLKELKQAHCLPGTLKEQLVLLSLFLNKISPQSSWKEHMYDLFGRYENFVAFEHMGFNQNWSTDPFWNA